jgi:hypothetical protein
MVYSCRRQDAAFCGRQFGLPRDFMNSSSIKNSPASVSGISSSETTQLEPIKLHVAEGSDPPIELLLKNADYRSSPIPEADFIVYPFLVRSEMDSRKTIARISKQFRSAKKKVIVFILDDHEGGYPFYENLFLLRTSAQAGKLAANERVMPYLWECKDEPFAPTSTGDALPSIGFCGQSSSHRKALMEAFETSPSIRSNFVKRDAFWGGNPHDAGLKADFWENMQQNQFALAPRGAGNFSMRFYQALSVGRIPVLINTDMALPFSDLIPWKDFIVFEANEAQCVRRLLEIFDMGQVAALQQMCHQMFHGYLSHKVFLGHLLQQLKTAGEIKTASWWTRWKRIKN